MHAFRPPLLLPTSTGSSPPTDNRVEARAAAEPALLNAVLRARSVASDIAVSTRRMHGSAGWTLPREAHDARLLVVGSHGRSALRGLLAGSVSVHVARHSPCPVVVVGPRTTQAPTSRHLAPSRRRGRRPNTVLHTRSGSRDLDAISGTPAMTEVLARRTIEKKLDRWHDEYAHVSGVTELA